MSRRKISGNQDAQHAFLWDLVPGETLYQGGVGCVAADTLVWDNSQQRGRRIDELYADGLPVQVMTTRGPIWSPPPVRVGVSELLTIELEDGRSVTVTPEHRFYGRHGWMRTARVRVGTTLLCSPGSHYASDLSAWPADDRHSLRTGVDSPGDCRLGFRLYGQQLPTGSETGPVSFPSPVDALALCLDDWHADGRADGAGHTRACPPFVRRATLDCVNREHPVDLSAVRLAAGNAAYIHALHQPACTYRWSSSRPCATEESAPAYVGTEMMERCARLDRLAWDAPLVHKSTGQYMEVKAIHRAGRGFYYDINVPEFGHYLANGIWHHNSGKTWAGSRKLMLLTAANKTPGLVVAPTYGDLHRFVLPALAEACKDWKWPFLDRSSDDAPHVIVGGMTIWTISADHPERFAGFEVGQIWIDEGARIHSDLNNPLRDAPTQIRTRLRAPLAKSLHMLVTTTPEGLDTWIQRDFFDAPIPSRRHYIGQTRLNSALPPEYLANQLAGMPPELAKQYLEGIATSYAANRAHSGFSSVVGNNVATFEVDPKLPLHLGADYNVDPMAWLVAQAKGDTLYIVDELYLTGGMTVDVAMHHAHSKGWGKYVVVLHPDKSAKARSTVGDPEFVVMQQTARALQWKFSGTSSGANPPVAARIANLSRLCVDAAGKRRLIVHPRCKRVIDEMERTGRLSSGQYDPGPQGSRGHILDALGYVAWDVYPPTGKMGVAHVPGL